VKKLRTVVVVLAVLSLGSCVVNVDREVYFDAKDMVTDIMKAAPVFINDLIGALPSQHSRSPMPRSISDALLGTVYNAFKDFDLTRADETSAQGVDESDMYVAVYKNLNYLQKILADTGNDINEHATPIAVTTPFPLLLGTDAAWSKSGTAQDNWSASSGFRYTASWVGNFSDSTVEATIAMTEKGDKDPGDPRQITMARTIYINQDLSGGATTMDIAYAVDMDWPGDPQRGIYAPRVWLKGNLTSGRFLVSGGSYGLTPGSQKYTAYRGSGTNASGDYMIFQAASLEWTGETGGPSSDSPTNATYYKIPGGATEAQVGAVTGYASLAALVAAVGDPKDYGSLLAGAPLFAYVDFPHGVGSFANDNALNLP
jgi:hypothetical protein